MKQAKISVLIVTYKQADVIGRNIESILNQKEDGLHEIVICDDCSPDNNWEVIQSYVQKYPNTIKAYRNETNLGIYGNSDSLVTLRGDADLYCWLEGDDALEPGIFKAIQNYIHDNRIDMTEAIGIFSDYSIINPNGDKFTYPNNLIVSDKKPLSLYIRGLVSWRASFFSNKVLEQFKPTILDKGLGLAEMLFDSQWFRYVNKSYYCPTKGSIYYSEIGVSRELGIQSSFRKEQALIKWTYFLSNGLALNKTDENWIKFRIYQAKLLITPSVLNLIKAIFCYFKGMSGFNVPFYPNFKKYFYPIIKNWRS